MIAEVMAAYPGWTRRRAPGGEGTVIAGTLVIADSSGSQNRAVIEVMVPRSFPAAGVHPQAHIVDHNFERSLTEDAHVGLDGHMCVQMPERNEINYARVGLVGFFVQVELHVRRARIWVLTGRFPGPEYAHFDAGRREYQKELPALRAPFEALKSGLPPRVAFYADPSSRLPRALAACPCGSGASFKACHRSELKRRRMEWRAMGEAPRPPMRSGAMLVQLGRFLKGRRHR